MSWLQESTPEKERLFKETKEPAKKMQTRKERICKKTN